MSENTPAAAEHNMPEFSVGEISQALKRALEDTFGRVRVRGEVSGAMRAASGHIYFSLKDEDAVLEAVCWRGTAGRLAVVPEDGMEVVVTGRVTTYAARSKYQIVVESLELAGEGALLKLIEDRRKKLDAEGLFDAERKRPLPFLPDVIGVVTSPTGAVIRDILHRLGDRFPRHVLLWPVLVQGEDAAQQIAAAIAGFNGIEGLGRGATVPRPDLLIVARGGGSVEDLWAFNEEIVVRAAAESTIPLISAVGHETDTTLVDFAADVRAPTPTAAAEMAVPVRIELLAQVMDDGGRMVAAVNRMLAERRTEVEGLGRGLPHPGRMVEEAAHRVDDWSERLSIAARVGIEARSARLSGVAARLASPRHMIVHAGKELAREAQALHSAMKRALAEQARRLEHARALLESYSYTRVLERGFALVSDEAGAPVTSAEALTPGLSIGVRFGDGEAAATVTGVSSLHEGSGPAMKRRPAARRRSPAKDKRQGRLL
jgi:exodeoxyribonuclease VII large subunit